MPGPTPLFTDQINVKVSRTQREMVEQWALIFGVSVSELVRMVLVAGLTDIENHATADPSVRAAWTERNQHAEV